MASVAVIWPTSLGQPMLLRAMCYSDRPLDELAELALDGARQGVLPATAPGPQNQASRGARHDPLDRQDQ